MTNNDSQRSARAIYLLVAGAFVGLVFAGYGAFVSAPDTALTSDQSVAAYVNNSVVTEEELARAIEAASAGRRNELTNEGQRRILSRLIDEELLTQRGIEIGLVEQDRSVRKSIVNAMVQFILSENQSKQVTDAELKSFYQENQNFFAVPERFHVRRLYIDKTAAPSAVQEKLQEISRAMAGNDDFAEIIAQLGDSVVLKIPDLPLPKVKLIEYLGPTIVEQVIGLNDGEISAPIETTSGVHMIQMIDRVAANPRPFEEMRNQITAEYHRRLDEKAMRSYLDWLRENGDITVVERAEAQ